MPHLLSCQSAFGRRFRPARPRGGFALLVTIVLVAFLVLVLVGLASFTRVETQIASNSTQLAQARSNALFGLNLALGQLQQHAGPDQRVTARADIDPANTGNPLWTGVWDATPRDSTGAPLAVPTHAAAPASPAPLVWLVSGNETNGVALSPATPAVAMPETNNDSVWLLRQVVGSDLSDPENYPTDLSVRLAKTPIHASAEQIPGADASAAPVRIGSYAWWVGDEGVKAKVTLADPYRTAAADSAEAAYRREAAPKPDPTLLTGSAYQTTFANPTVAFEAMREGVLSMEQLPLLHADLAAEEGRKQTGGYIHDLTPVGHGVLADTLRGGLRRDLTRGLAAPPSAGSVAATEIGEDVAVFTPPAPGPFGRTAKTNAWTPSNLSDGGVLNGESHAPTWSQVRSWWNTRAPSNGSGLDPVDAPLVTTTRNGITVPFSSGHAVMPVVAMLELGYGLDVDDASRTYRILIRPVVVLMNPYNVALESATYSVIYQSSVTSDSHLTFRMTQGSTPAHPSGDFFLTSGAGLITPNPGSGDRRMSFNITDEFGPGEVRVYSLPAAGDFQVNDGIFNLVSGLSTNRAWLNTNTAVPAAYDPSLRDSTNIQWSKVPADHPRISLALGPATATTVTPPSMIARYIQTASSYLYGSNASPKNVTMVLGTGPDGPARQMRTLRYTLRHAELDLLAYPNSNMLNQGETGTVPNDQTSGARFLIDGNPRAALSQRLGGRDSVANYAVRLLNGTGYSEIDYDDAGDKTLGYWGGSVEIADGANRIILFDVPRTGEEIVSLGRLGHVNWGIDGKHPSYPLGNSFASIFYPHNAPDYGYALNEALWDRFFLSTLPASLSTRPAYLANSRLRFHDPDGSTDLSALENINGYELAATRLLADGAFNVNSTSVEAWTAFLGSVQAADYRHRTQAGGNVTDAAARVFPRLRNLHDPDPTASGNAGNMYEWSGYRRLDDAQLKALAIQIVAGIKARGRPARSLAEFMNRDLTKPSTDINNQMGVVQAAIDEEINTADPSSGGGSLDDLAGLNTPRIVPAAFDIADNPDAARGKLRSTGAPGFLMQSDLLTPLAPAMSARSDTFRVRAYGEARNPATGEITGRAWCEAVLQRLPEFVGGENAELRLDDPGLGAASKNFGRKFVVIQFRWLGPQEI